MKLHITAEIGVCDKYKVEVDKTTGEVAGGLIDEGPFVALLNTSLRLKSDEITGKILGLFGSVGDYSNYEKKSFALPEYIEGEARFNLPYRLGKNALYLSDFLGDKFVDEELRFIMLGKVDDNLLFIKICENVYLGVDGDCLCGIVIEL